ncbi:non-ribosomal peptide synthetase [Streptomyces sp. JV178]|uniref:non-ribosomal peptide synthetase n=1 Tax=Streptomyces sp. JV178 TaxID=858632 RepID=UPI000C1AFD52|nr:non-ribosomal peptide synthetase [Streptomyces sp. JV178]PIM67858.1 non-ribosomal peptide synthetase [Streptomyces sp. JV178]
MQPNAEWSAGRPSVAPDEGLHETFARLARVRPDASALIEGEHTVTYGELDRVADTWAARLAAAGAGPGDLVPVLLPRGRHLVAALLAVLKTGAAYALLDPDWPEQRLADIRTQLNPPLAVGAPGTRLGLDEPVLPVWTPPPWPPYAEAAPPGFRPVSARGADPACVFFTSGTTGRPKGVLTPHRATARLFPPDGFAAFTADTVMPLAAAVSWDAFSLELWSVLLNGGTSLITEEAYLTPTALRSGVTRHGTNTVWLTSSLFNMIVDEDPDAFEGLRQVLIGGERLSASHVHRFLRRHPDTALINGYGPVESTVFTTTHRVTEADCDLPGGIPLGRPVPGTRVYVLDPDGTRPCAVGETGELCVAGDGLALRYLGAPSLTDEKFRTLPVGPDGEGVRVYRTGDLVEWDGDGLLHYRGRADRQVKIRGHRVEPAEVERQVERLLPSVRSCRVLARPDGSGASLELVAFCTPTRPGDPLTDALPALHAALVPYQRPVALVSVDGFPTTDRGKLDERALLSLAETAAPTPSAPSLDGPRDSTDPYVDAVAETFAAVLGRESVPLDVPFTDLGGASLGAGRVCARLAGRFGRPVPVAQFYRRTTVTALADWLRATADAQGPEPADVPHAADGTTPLTPMQIVYLTRQLVAPTDLTSHCLLTWAIEGEPDREALRAAVAAVHRRHEALRAAYVADPRPSAVLVDIPPPELEALPDEPTVDAAVSSLRAELTDALDLPGGEVWRTALVRVAETGTGTGTGTDITVFGVVVHHIAFDGWSESVLARDLASAYAEARRSTPDTTPRTPPPSLRDQYIERSLHRTLADTDTDAGGGTAAQRDFLVAELTGVPELRWASGPLAQTSAGPVPPLDTGSGPARVEAWVGPAVLRAVDRLAADCGVTRFVALLALWAGSVAEVTGQRDFAVGVPVAQRDGAGLEDVVGCHITTLCLRLRGTALSDTALSGTALSGTALSGTSPDGTALHRTPRGGDPAAALRATGAVTARALAAHDVPFGDVLTLVDPPRTGRPPLYQVLFALQDNPAPNLELPGLRTTFLRQPYLELPLELHTECWPDGDGGLRVETAFRPDAVPPAVAHAIAERFSQRLDHLERPEPPAPAHHPSEPSHPRPAPGRPAPRRSPS